jgi:hypothetical protein
MSDNVAVKFRRPWGSYNSGEVAGFPEHVARRLCHPSGGGEGVAVDLHDHFGRTRAKAEQAPPEDKMVTSARVKSPSERSGKERALAQALEHDDYHGLGRLLAALLPEGETTPRGKPERRQRAADLLGVDLPDVSEEE